MRHSSAKDACHTSQRCSCMHGQPDVHAKQQAASGLAYMLTKPTKLIFSLPGCQAEPGDPLGRPACAMDTVCSSPHPLDAAAS